MKNYILIILTLFVVASCEKKEQIVVNIADGVYIGTFQRKPVWANSEVANITMTFSQNEWSGSSDMSKYPALCHGTYSIKGDTIIFNNECEWTAEFDWSLILSGKYFLVKEGNIIEFTKDYRNAYTDTYVDSFVLVKQE